MKLWLKGENSDKLHDYSLLNNNAHLWSAYQVAEHYQRDDPDNMAGHETVAYANNTHYIHVQDNPDLRISDLIVDEPTREGFTVIIRYSPLSYGISKQESIILEQKIDSSQNRYGHSVNVDDEGNIYFYVKYNYRQYFVKMIKPIQIPTNFANYTAVNYKPENYKTEVAGLSDTIGLSYDLVCQFNYSTKECSIRVLINGQIINYVSSLTGETALPSNLQIHLPLQEGKWSETKTLPNNLPLNQVFDSSTNQRIGTTVYPNRLTWQDDNTLLLKGTETSGANIEIPNHSSFNTFTEMTFCFWYKPLSNNLLTNRLITIGDDGVSYIKIQRPGATNDLRLAMSIVADGTNNKQLDYTNAFPTFNQWYFVVCKWKTGEASKISINNGTDLLHADTQTGTFTETTQPFELLNWREDNGIMINIMFFNRQITATEQTKIYNYGNHLAQFPTNLEPQRLTNPNPVPITNPVTTIYDLPKIVSPTINDYTFINNPSTQNPFIEKYTCADGVSGSVAEETIYNIAAGTGGTTVNPFATPYTLPGVSSTGMIDEPAGEWGYGQQILVTGSVLYNKKITEIQCWLDKSSAVGGSIYLGILKADGVNYIPFGTAIPLTALTGGWISFTKQLLTNTYPMVVGDAVAVIWIGGTSGQVWVRRGGSGTHYDKDTSNNPRSCQNHTDNTGWGTTNTSYSMAGTFKTGGDTVGTSPYYSLKNATNFNYVVGEYFPAGSPILAQIPTYAAFRVYREAAATNGTVSIRHVKADGTYYETLFQINVVDLPTIEPTTFNFVWQNLNYTRQMIADDRIAVVVEGQTTGLVYALSNIGNSGTANSYDTTRSYLNYRNFSGTWGSATTLDISGLIKKGGNTFIAKMQFSPTVTRIYERAVNANSSFYDQALSKIVSRGKRVGTIPSPSTMTCVLRSDANVLKATIGTFDANAISTLVLQDIPFTNNNNVIKIAIGDYVSIEIATCDATNYIELNINNNVVDVGNSIIGKLDAGIINDLAGNDLAGKFYIGGQVDNVSRPRVSQFINTQDSIFLKVVNNRITTIIAVLTKVGLPTGTIYFNIRRGSDDALIYTLGTYSASSVTTALTGTVVTISNFLNNYILAAKDKISIEFEGGDQSNNIGVQIRTVTPDYDGINSYISRYNGVAYDYLTTKDLVATMKVGGDTYTPDPNTPPPVLPQNPTDLYILSDINKRVSSFMRGIFGMYLFFNTLLTATDLVNFNNNRIDTGGNLPNEIQVTNHSFLRNS